MKAIKIASVVQKLWQFYWRDEFAYWWSCIGKGLCLQPRSRFVLDALQTFILFNHTQTFLQLFPNPMFLPQNFNILYMLLVGVPCAPGAVWCIFIDISDGIWYMRPSPVMAGSRQWCQMCGVVSLSVESISCNVCLPVFLCLPSPLFFRHPILF